jgi:hypothetical protein
MGFCNLWSTLGELCVCRVCNPVIECLLPVRMPCHWRLDSNPCLRQLVCACITCGAPPHRSFSVLYGRPLKPHPIFLTSCWSGTVERQTIRTVRGGHQAKGGSNGLLCDYHGLFYDNGSLTGDLSHARQGEKEHTSFAWMDGWRHIPDIPEEAVLFSSCRLFKDQIPKRSL